MSTEARKPNAKKAKPRAPAQHPKYSEMIIAAIVSFKDRNGSSRQKIVKYIRANYNVKDGFETQVRFSLKRMIANGTLIHVKGTGASGSFKLARPQRANEPAKKAVKKKVTTPTKKPVKKTVTTKPKKATPAKKKTTPKKDKPKIAKKATPKKTAAAKKPVTKKPKTQAKKPTTKKSPKKAAK